jgi:hypothetical protein
MAEAHAKSSEDEEWWAGPCSSCHCDIKIILTTQVDFEYPTEEWNRLGERVGRKTLKVFDENWTTFSPAILRPKNLVYLTIF